MRSGYWESDKDRTALYSCTSCALNNTGGTIHIRVLQCAVICGGPGSWCAGVMGVEGIRMER